MQVTQRAFGLAVFFLAACGDDVAALRVELIPQGSPNPLDMVQRLRLIATGPVPMEKVEAEASRDAGRLELPAIPLGPDRVITVEGIDKDDVIVARGQSDPFSLSRDSPRTVKILFSSCTATLYRDADGDKHGDDKLTKTACDGTISGYVDKKGDCNDSDADAHPGQTQYFDRPTTGTQSFDFDCDGKESREHPSLEVCKKEPPNCVGEGWESAVPACGQSGTFVPCEKGSCSAALQGSQKTQRCR